MFPGKHYLDQICKIQEVLGSPSKDDLSFITNPKAQLYVSSLPLRPTVAWAKVYPNANERQLNMLNRLLVNASWAADNLHIVLYFTRFGKMDQ